MNLSTFKPQAIVTFYNETSDLVVRTTGNPNSLLDKDIISIITCRNMSADVPTFSVVLSCRKHWNLYIGANDIVVIQMWRPPEAQQKVFVGLVDDIRKTLSISATGVVQRSITLTGRGIGKAFINFDIGIVPEVSGPVSTTMGWLVSEGLTFSTNTADSIISQIITYFKKFINYAWGKDRTLWDLFSMSLVGMPDMQITQDIDLANWQGSIWTLLKQLAEDPFYELFWEMEDISVTVGKGKQNDRKPTLILRPTPFDQPAWKSLQNVKITDRDVVAEQLGRSDTETYTMFSVGMKSLISQGNIAQTLGIAPYWEPQYAKKYGIRRLDVESSYTSGTETDGKESLDSTAILLKLMAKLYNWNVINNSMYNGILTVRGSNRYSMGSKLEYQSDEDGSDLTYYTQSVTQQFVNFVSWTTQVSVIRGINEKYRFTAPVGVLTPYTDIGFGDIINTSTIGGASGDVGINGPLAAKVVAGAELWVNKHCVTYELGGPGILAGRGDCSQFTQFIFETYASIDIGRVTGQQVTYGISVARNALSPADIILFQGTYVISGASHVGIYIGNNNFIALGSKGICVNSLGNSYWTAHYMTARRVLPASDSAGGSGGGSGGSGTISKYLTNHLAGTADIWVAAGKQYGVDPILAVAIARQETGNGQFTNGNNVGGMMRSAGGLMSFSNVTAGIQAMVKNLKTNYIADGLTTIVQIGSRYCPVGASNDPTGLNGNWVPSVTKFYKQMGGTQTK